MKTSLLVAVSALSLMWSGVAFAQAPATSPVEIDSAADVSAELGRNSARTSGSEAVVYQDYRLPLKAGQALKIDLVSSDFDAYLELYREGQTSGEPLAFNDDRSGQGMDSRLRYVAEADETFIIRVRPYSGTQGGRYQLTLSEPEAHNYPQGRALVRDQSVSGSLHGKSPRDEDENRFEAYVWTAQAGERMALSHASDDFDAVLSLGQVRAGRYVELASNDDGPEGLNAYLIFTAPEAGDYYIKAMATDPEADGRYRLKLEDGPPQAQVRPITLDRPVDGTLTYETGIGFSEHRADQWRFRGQAGQRLSATVTSDDFDAFVELFTAEGRSLAEDDDSAGELNARLIHTLTQDGDYVIEARGFSDATGDYELTLKILPPAPKPAAIRFGQTLQGELKDGVAEDDRGRRYAGYVFEGRENQRVQVTVRSGDFDAMSEIGKAGSDMDEFEALGQDDDGLNQGTDSRLHFTLPEDGRYEIRALGLGTNAKGLYSIELEDRGPEPRPGSLLVPSVARGTLTDQDSLTDEGHAYDAYSFKAKADEKLRFTLISAEFDALVEVGEVNGDNWRKNDSDDDSLSDRHARLDWSAPRDGTYQVRVRGYAPTSKGAYSLIVERQP
jgi:hypothetical protein